MIIHLESCVICPSETSGENRLESGKVINHLGGEADYLAGGGKCAGGTAGGGEGAAGGGTP